MKSYREFEVYKVSKAPAVRMHKMSLVLPTFALHEEGSQVRRSSKSVASTIDKGYGCRRYKTDFIKCFVYSQSECDETIVHLDFLFETEFLKEETLYNDLKNEYDVLSKRSNTFLQWVEVSFNP